MIAGVVAGAYRPVQAIIREDAAKAEDEAKKARKHAKEEVERLGRDAFAADQRAREKREEATRLAADEPAQRTVVDDPLGPGPGKERAEWD